ncbi:MAG: hypothetical protein AAB116_13215 [Candidatus Poribacteria bacterium]
MKYMIVLGFITFVFFGCASLPKLTSGKIGCPPDEIKITDDNASIGTRTWIAKCRGKRYFCSAQAAGYTTDISCKEETPTQPK